MCGPVQANGILCRGPTQGPPNLLSLFELEGRRSQLTTQWGVGLHCHRTENCGRSWWLRPTVTQAFAIVTPRWSSSSRKPSKLLTKTAAEIWTRMSSSKRLLIISSKLIRTSSSSCSISSMRMAVARSLSRNFSPFSRRRRRGRSEKEE